MNPLKKFFQNLKSSGQTEHYICLGGCNGVSKNPGVCQAEDCRDHNHELIKCDCEDGMHNNFSA